MKTRNKKQENNYPDEWLIFQFGNAQRLTLFLEHIQPLKTYINTFQDSI